MLQYSLARSAETHQISASIASASENAQIEIAGFPSTAGSQYAPFETSAAEAAFAVSASAGRKNPPLRRVVGWDYKILAFLLRQDILLSPEFKKEFYQKYGYTNE